MALSGSVSQTYVQLCEFSILTQLGTDLAPLIKFIASNGSVPLSALS